MCGFALTKCLSAKRELLESLYSGQFTLSTPLIKPNFCVLLPHRRSATVSLETIPFIQWQLGLLNEAGEG